MPDETNQKPMVLDPRQLIRIEATHRGFLYQHLYAASCLLLAANAGAIRVVVEGDDDVEIAFPDRRLYVQVKTRQKPLIFADISGALDRFATLRKLHESGKRPEKAAFVIAANTAPGPELAKRIADSEWPPDVTLQWPAGPASTEAALPRTCANIEEAFKTCCELAQALPFAILAAETLAWKLAGVITSAAAGEKRYEDHAFEVAELPNLFEQIVIQLQDFPAPPERYRPQDQEPPLVTAQRVRLIVGYSGAGKTSWVSQAALHASDALAYFNVTDVPTGALVSTVAREIAARLFGKPGGKLGEILLPGATGTQILFMIGKRLAEAGTRATVVIDNAHRVSDAEMRSLIEAAPNLHFVLLAQPAPAVSILESTLGISAEPLRGWTNETTAAEGAALGCKGDYAAYEKLLGLTGGLPLYAQNALRLASTHYGGSVQAFCAELDQQTHVVSTAQELILTRIFDDYSDDDQHMIGVISLLDVPLTQAEASKLLVSVHGWQAKEVAALFRTLRSAGSIQIFGVDQFKVHDAMRLIGRSHLEKRGPEAVRNAQVAVKEMLLKQLPESHSSQRVSLLLRMFVALRDVKPLVDMATDEIFHELGYIAEIRGFLEELVTSEEVPAEDRFAALDGLVLNLFRKVGRDDIEEKLTLMERLVAEHGLGDYERLSVLMKRMMFHAEDGNEPAAIQAMEDLTQAIPDRDDYRRIARYNIARAFNSLGDADETIAIAEPLIAEYYKLLGLTPEQVIGNNPDKIAPLLKQAPDLTDNLKHLADTLELHAIAVEKNGGFSPFVRIHAMKFYNLTHSFDSFVRVGQDLVDEFVQRNDYEGALDVFEKNLIPVVVGRKMSDHIIAVRSQYAVVLGYAGKFADADAEMARLAPYEDGLSDRARGELQDQLRLIQQLKRLPPPPQWEMPQPKGKYPVNAPCFCGSGKKFKKCHGRRDNL